MLFGKSFATAVRTDIAVGEGRGSSHAPYLPPSMHYVADQQSDLSHAELQRISGHARPVMLVVYTSSRLKDRAAPFTVR